MNLKKTLIDIFACCVGVALLLGVLTTCCQSSGPYTHIGNGFYRGVNGKTYIRSESSERYRVRVTRYDRYGCAYSTYEWRTRPKVSWHYVHMDTDNYDMKSYAAKGWKELLIAKEAKAEEQDAFLTALSLSQRKRGAFTTQPGMAALYGGGSGTGGQGGYGYQNTVQTQSLYGYPTAQSYAGQYSNANANLVDLQAATRMFHAANASQDKIAANVMGLMNQGAALSREQLKYLAIQAIVSTPESHTRSETSTVAPTQPVPTPQPNVPDASVLVGQLDVQVQAVLSARCTSCHDSDNPPGGMDLTDWSALALADKNSVYQAVANGTMPVKKDGTEYVQGTPLAPSQVELIKNAAFASALAN